METELRVTSSSKAKVHNYVSEEPDEITGLGYDGSQRSDDRHKIETIHMNNVFVIYVYTV